MEYKDLKAGISSHLNAAAEDFFMVGYFLRQISENALFTEDGYKNIWDFAKVEYGLSTSSASRFMAINARFSIDGGEHMAEKYIGMGVSKLQEMLSLPDEELEKVTKETTVREIRALKAQATKPLSFYGFPATKRPAGSLLTTPGCGEGKYDCFSCCRDCAIRQEERYCVTAPMGNPFPCSQMGKYFKVNIQCLTHKDRCQIFHPELAPVRAGDKEPSPCCLNCDIKTCSLRCDVTKKRDEQEQREREEAERQRQREAEAAERQRQREAEAAKPEPSDEDIEALYDWYDFKTSDAITADGLKKKMAHAGGSGGSRLKDYQGSARGVRINYKRELTYSKLAKRLTECQERRRQAEEKARPDIIDADFREVTDEPEDLQEQAAQEQAEAAADLCGTCAHEGECAGRKTSDTGCMGYEEAVEAEIVEAQEQEPDPDPEAYTIRDVKDRLDYYEQNLQAHREAEAPIQTTRKQRIIRDALRLLYEKLQEEAAADED